MVRTPDYYVHLANLADHVNPVVAKLTVYAAEPALLELVVKNEGEDPWDETGWTALPETAIEIPAGVSSHILTSGCLGSSGKRHVRGRISSLAGEARATSDLHYVIVDASIACD